jgi:hypothetical protein
MSEQSSQQSQITSSVPLQDKTKQTQPPTNEEKMKETTHTHTLPEAQSAAEEDRNV